MRKGAGIQVRQAMVCRKYQHRMREYSQASRQTSGPQIPRPTPAILLSPAHALRRVLRTCLMLWAALWIISAAGADLVLHATQAQEARNLQAFQQSELAAFYMTGQLADTPRLTWKVNLAEAGAYRVSLLARSEVPEVKPRLLIDDKVTPLTTLSLPRAWDRLEIGVVGLAQGPNALKLELVTHARLTGRVDIQAIELTRVSDAQQEERQTTKARADASWMRQAGFGLMLHWTRESAPARGPTKPYAQAVEDLDVDNLAENLRSTGAGFVVFTTAHGYQDFPAPLAALDKALQGRTCRRDLIADLAASLQRKGLRLMLYHNPGTAQDPAWVEASGLKTADRTRYFNLWQAMISEAGDRYGDKLAGWWFDDGATRLYPQNAPWASLHRAARSGHSARLIGFNSWELPSVTDWQDFDCGEGLREPRGREGRLQPSDDGVYRSSSRQGQQATACVTLENDWLHRDSGQMPSPPTWTEQSLRDFLTRSRQSGLVPIINLKVTQEGLLGPESLALIRRAAQK